MRGQLAQGVRLRDEHGEQQPGASGLAEAPILVEQRTGRFEELLTLAPGGRVRSPEAHARHRGGTGDDHPAPPHWLERALSIRGQLHQPHILITTRLRVPDPGGPFGNQRRQHASGAEREVTQTRKLTARRLYSPLDLAELALAVVHNPGEIGEGQACGETSPPELIPEPDRLLNHVDLRHRPSGQP